MILFTNKYYYQDNIYSYKKILMSNITDLSDLVICLEKYVERKINKAINNYKELPSRENCIQFYSDLTKCIDNNQKNDSNYIKGTLWNNIDKQNYFDFTKCP
jgi:hypothetical protein